MNFLNIVTFSGYDLCANRSGKTSEKALPVISKKGNGELRYALYQAAKVAVSRVDLFRTYFTKLLRGRERERGIKTKMHVKLVPPCGTGDCLDFNEKREVFNPDYINIE